MDDSLNQEFATGTSHLVIDPRRLLGALRSWIWEHRAQVTCAALLLMMAGQMLGTISRKSITVDEIVMIPAGYYHLSAGNTELVFEHPPLAKIISAIPMLFIQPHEIDKASVGFSLQSGPGKWRLQEMFWDRNANIIESISFWPRVAMIGLAVVLGIVLFVFARNLFGARAAVLTVALYSLEPTVLAHGRVVQTDMAAAFGYVLVVFALYRYVRRPSARGAVLMGCAGAIACLAKYSMLIVAPALAVVFIFLLWQLPRRGTSRKWVVIHACLVFVSAALVIQAAYFFNVRSLHHEDVAWINAAFPATRERVFDAIGALSYFMPTDYVLGTFWQIFHNREGHGAGLLGMYSNTGWWYYFPVAFALKTTLAFLLLSVSSILWAAYQLVRERDLRFLLLLAPIVIFMAGAMAGNLNIGVRYLLPMYMFCFILGGAFLDRLLSTWKTKRPVALVSVALLIWMGVETVRWYPNHLTYMNQIASGRPHWWYLSDSNVEWGDDVKELALYLRDRGEVKVRASILAGFLTLRYYGVEYVDAVLTNPQPQTRYIAIGASYLNGSTVTPYFRNERLVSNEERVNTFDAYRGRKPEVVIGNSIYVFRESD